MGAKDIEVKIDRKLAVAWKAQHAKLMKASQEGAHDWDARYEAIAAILEHEPPLYLAGGYSTDKQFIDEVLHEDRTSVLRNVHVATCATADDVALYGATKLSLAIALLEAKNGGPLKHGAPIAFAKLRCTFKQSGKTATKPFAQCSAAEVRAAISLARGPQADKAKSPEAKAVAAALKKSGSRETAFSISKQRLTLHVPLADLVKVAKALVSYQAPT